MGLLGAISVGITFGLLEIIFEKRLFRNLSYGKLLVAKSLIYIMIFVSTMALLSMRNQQISYGYFDFQLWQSIFFQGNMIIPISFMAFAGILLNFIRVVSLKFGPGNLWHMLNGKFHRPRQEERILMFLDLKSATAIAEKLGHIKFSELIQDCFSDLGVVQQYRAEVYQYVGDEAVLAWDITSGLRDNNCIKAYFAFMDVLNNRSGYYQQKYGLVPFFKAGMNLGYVTIAEVGSIKKEIAFHGDTVNTAARIQAICNQFSQGLLITESLAQRLQETDEFSIESLGLIPLKGKLKEVDIYSIHRAGSRNKG
jgi:adenylate cyclase